MVFERKNKSFPFLDEELLEGLLKANTSFWLQIRFFITSVMNGKIKYQMGSYSIVYHRCTKLYLKNYFPIFGTKVCCDEK